MHQSSFFEKWGSVVAGKQSKWVVLALWIVVVVLLSVIFPSVNKEENNNAALLPTSAPSVKAMQELKKAFPNDSGLPALVVWYDKGGLTTAELQDAKQLAAQLKANPLAHQKSVLPLDKMPVTVIKGLESNDHTTLVIPVVFNANTSATALQSAMTQLNNRLEKTAGHNVTTTDLSAQGLHVRITGPAGITSDAQGLFKNADVTLLAATGLLVLILLILLYRSPILAFVPLVSVGFAYGVISPLLGILAKTGIITVDAQGISIMTVLLFGAGTDYCLFLVARYREQLTSDENRYTAIRHAVGGAAGAIAMSGLTVVVSLLALLFAKYGSDHRFAVPFSVAIFIMGLAGLTLVPALLAILGRISFFPFIPRTPSMEIQRGKANRRKRENAGRFYRWNGKLVSTRPWPVVIVTVILLGVMAGFAGQIKPTYDLLSSFPKTMPSRQGYRILSNHFSKGSLAPVQVVVKNPTQKQTMTEVRKELQQLPFVESVAAPQQSTVQSKTELLTVTLKDDPYSLQAMNDIPTIRKTVNHGIQKIEGKSNATTLSLAGETATQFDTRSYTNQDTKTVIPIVIGIIALLLLLYLRSIVAMVYLMATVLLSYFSALGIGWLILHYVMGASAIAGAIPLYSFVFLVALGEDYNIFMVSRIWQERHNIGLQQAIADGVAKTSSVITSAGLILAGTFAVLASMPLQILVQFGIVTALGVLIDTFIVRPFLVPALTRILGRIAFWPSRP